MKKQLLFLAMLLTPMVANAAFEIDGIYYEVTSEPNEAEVTSNPQGYTGSVVIPATVIYNGAEYSVTSIGDWAFSDCSGLTTVTIGEGVREINLKAFASCPEITDVYCYAEEVPNTSTDAFMNSYIEDATLHVPESSITAYQVTEPWKQFINIVAIDENNGITHIIDAPILIQNNEGIVCKQGTGALEQYLLEYSMPMSSISGWVNEHRKVHQPSR